MSTLHCYQPSECHEFYNTIKLGPSSSDHTKQNAYPLFHIMKLTTFISRLMLDARGDKIFVKEGHKPSATLIKGLGQLHALNCHLELPDEREMRNYLLNTQETCTEPFC